VFDLITIGRISVDIYGQEEGAGLEDQQSFKKAVGGSPTNVAIGTVRYGHRVGLITGVGDDSFGKYALSELRKFKVETEFVSMYPGKTPVVIAGLKNPGDPELVFYRDKDAPDTQMQLSPAMEFAVSKSKFFWYTGSTLANPKLRSTVHSLLNSRALDNGEENIFDLDFRPSFWNDQADAHLQISAALKYSQVVIGNRIECSVATGLPITSDSKEFADSLLASGVRLAIVKDGANGVLVADKSGSRVIPGIKVRVRCGLGAGDAFGAGVVHGLLNNWTPAQSVEFANAAGAHVASQLMCSDAMPTEIEVKNLMSTK